MGSETSQKIHNALKWIIRRQGNFFDTLVLVTWEAGKQGEKETEEMPEWDAGTDEIISDFEMSVDALLFGSSQDEKWDGKQLTAKMFGKALNGYRRKVENTAHMILLGFDASTPGRLAMVEEKELDSAKYLFNIQKWHEECGWIHETKKDGEEKSFWGMVGVRDFADILFGIENNGYLTVVDAKLYAQVAKRLIPCIWDAQKVPYDFVNRAVAKASMPLSYKDRKNWERVLTLACSLVKKYRKDNGYKEEWNVAVDHECKERDYLYGRLLAVADRIEYRTYEKQQDDSRVTNAKRYMNAFSQRPYETWKVIEENIQPYLNKLLMIQEKRYYENLLNTICSLFTVENYSDNTKLSGLYLLGYHCQAYDLKNYKEKNADEYKEE